MRGGAAEYRKKTGEPLWGVFFFGGGGSFFFLFFSGKSRQLAGGSAECRKKTLGSPFGGRFFSFSFKSTVLTAKLACRNS